ncbi:MFS transporter [Haloactinospora alba]|uniref:MFS transporter n=1 Tax=Haloactinospora alba TaxID=405555 RepID=A0A543NEJ0_9ACTN|nr:MFS transporter [Haloactinospora alba]TQN30235.1 MFS transporter [Haloactinospora alba]
MTGGAIIANVGWRPVFGALAALALVMFLGVLACVRETLPEPERTRGGVSATVAGARQALANRDYLGYLLTFCFAFAAVFAYISASPYVVQNVMGMSAGTHTMIFGLNALVILVTSSVAAALAGRVAYRAMIAAGPTVAVLASVVLLALIVSGVPTVPVLVLFAVFQGSLGFVFANATTLALEETGANAGTGSGFLGFLQFALAAVISPLVGIGGEDTAVPMGLAMVISIVLAVLAVGTLPRRNTPHGGTTAPAGNPPLSSEPAADPAPVHGSTACKGRSGYPAVSRPPAAPRERFAVACRPP